MAGRDNARDRYNTTLSGSEAQDDGDSVDMDDDLSYPEDEDENEYDRDSFLVDSDEDRNNEVDSAGERIHELDEDESSGLTSSSPPVESNSRKGRRQLGSSPEPPPSPFGSSTAARGEPRCSQQDCHHRGFR